MNDLNILKIIEKIFGLIKLMNVYLFYQTKTGEPPETKRAKIKMKYFIRYTETPKKDLQRGVSFHHNSEAGEYNEEFGYNVEKLNGLCAFTLESDNLEDAISEAAEFWFGGDYKSCGSLSYVILSGIENGTCEEGVTIIAKEILHTVKKEYFEEL